MSKHIVDNFTVSNWFRITDADVFNNVPFGVYALTEPTHKIPSKGIFPHQYDRTVYFGKSGISYDDFFYDRKNVDRAINAIGEDLIDKERFHRYSLLRRRIKQHLHNLRKKNGDIDREVSYTKFYEEFGFGDDVISKVNICVITPEYRIPNFQVKTWLLTIESYLIYMYQNNFGRNTLMNIDHSYEHNNKIIEDSHSQRKKNEIKESSLMEYFS